MKRTQQHARPDRRAPWQIAQGAACGCKGTDDMCACQNVEPCKAPGLAERAFAAVQPFIFEMDEAEVRGLLIAVIGEKAP